MNIVYNGIEILASFVEVFVLYKIYSILLYKQRGKQNFILDRELAIIGTVLIQICNHVSIFSYFTIILFVLYMSITAKIIYRRKYIELFSIASFYVLCLSCFDFLIFTLVSNFYGGYDTFTALVSTRGILRVVMICVIKFLWILLYFMIKKYLYSFSLKKNYVYTILIISCAGFLGFVYLVNQTFKAFNYTMTGVWFVFIAFWSLLFFTVYFVMESKEKKMKLDFEKMGGLIPAIVQDYNTNKVLMLGFMNEEAYEETKATGKVTFFSRTKNRIWMKGETSGNTLQVVTIAADCDNDTLLIKAIPAGPVCHTGADTCFGEKNVEDIMFLKYLQNFIEQRRQEMPEGSYTTTLFQKGINRMAQKVGEEAVETVIEATNGTDDRLVYEAADMLYHLIVLLTSKGLRIEDLARELKSRHKG